MLAEQRKMLRTKILKLPHLSPKTLPFICKREAGNGGETHLKWFRRSGAQGLNGGELVEETGEMARFRVEKILHAILWIWI